MPQIAKHALACATGMHMLHYLAQVKLEDVFKSTSESMNQTPAAERLIALILGTAALIILLVALQRRRRSEATPKVVHSDAKLIKEVLRNVPLKSAEVKQLRQLAENQSCSSPLVLLLCPSLLVKGLADRSPEERKLLANVV